ncbi:MAG: T9SS type B sorting domain-containing protein [Bacteroidales bacterium]|nr:T9SS type B sorting domain-containing protein [Candidatus Scybalocola fimicaballi]
MFRSLLQGEENWKVVNLEKFDNYTVTIFDRYGKLLATMVNDPEGWDGVYNGNKMPSTDYWYKVDVENTDMQYAGHFTLLRKK